ncbi:SulP family inorganic anion transporter [Streptomyces sp. NPDC048385]|uniref:SulP family inorganic anion transporter n=1 Tax=unclassified Streptomyces TaxID=2593676 RepID=UPI0034209D96
MDGEGGAGCVCEAGTCVHDRVPASRRPVASARHEPRHRAPGRCTRWHRGVRSRLGRPTRADVQAGAVTALFSVPEGMAYAAIAGFSPLAGLYTGAVPAVMGSLFARTALMVTTLTSAIALTSRTALSDAGLDPTDPSCVASLTLLVGVCMALFTALRLALLLRLVSGAAMTGFSAGIAVQIVAGAVDDATEYHSPHHNRLVHLADWFAHISTWSKAATAASAAAVVVWAVAHRHPRLHSLSILLALVTASAAVAVSGHAVPLAGSLGAVPAGLPRITLPDWQVLPRLLPGAAAVAVVAMAQAAGIPRTLSGSSGHKDSAAADILAQSMANLSGAFFQALPAGGSLSRTGVAQSAGARTRWAGVFSGLLLTVLVATIGPLAARIPLPVIGALVAVIGCKLIAARTRDIRGALDSGPVDAAAILLTFLATTQAPLDQALLVALAASLLARLAAPVRSVYRNTVAALSRS